MLYVSVRGRHDARDSTCGTNHTLLVEFPYFVSIPENATHAALLPYARVTYGINR